MTNKPVTEALKHVLADSYALYVKTQNYHWNVEGPQFASLHTLFETQYTDLATAIDEIAELIRGLGERVPASFDVYKSTSSLKAGNENTPAEQMVNELAADQELITRTLQKALTAAQTAGDEVVVNTITDRLTIHRKNHWMLKSITK